MIRFHHRKASKNLPHFFYCNRCISRRRCLVRRVVHRCKMGNDSSKNGGGRRAAKGKAPRLLTRRDDLLLKTHNSMHVLSFIPLLTVFCRFLDGKGGNVTKEQHADIRENKGHGGTNTAEICPKKRIVTMEPSVKSFAGPSASRRDRSDAVMITDALVDVRVK